MQCNLDKDYKFDDGAGYTFQYHVVLFLDLIIRQKIQLIKYNKLLFNTIKKYGRGEFKNRVLRLKKYIELTCIEKNSDILVGGHPLCFEDINFLYKPKRGQEKHAFIQVKGTGKGNISTIIIKKVLRNFLKNCNYTINSNDSERPVFFIISNYQINENIHILFNDIKSIDLLNLSECQILLSILHENIKFKSNLNPNILNKIIYKILKGDSLTKTEALKIENATNDTLVSIHQKLKILIKIIKNTTLIEHLSYSEIINTLEDYYGSNQLDILIRKIEKLSQQKANKKSGTEDFNQYLVYENTYFTPENLPRKVDLLEQGNFFHTDVNTPLTSDG